MRWTVPEQELTTLVSELLERGGAGSHSDLVARSLVDAELAGHQSHGVVKVSHYLKMLGDGHIRGESAPAVVSQTPTFVHLDAGFGFGQSAMAELVGLLAERAVRSRIAAGIISNCPDLGRLGPYARDAAAEGLVALLFANDAGWYPQVAPWGGREALFGTNPLAFACPVPGADPVVIDQSTSITAVGKLILDHRRDGQAPEGLLLDFSGEPTTSTAELFESSPRGSVLPLGAPAAGHKGYALALMVDILAGLLGGAGVSRRGPHPVQGLLMLVMDPNGFVDADYYREEMEKLIEAIQSNPPRPGMGSPRVPGWQSGQRPEAVEVDALRRDELARLAAALDVSLPPSLRA